MTDYEGGADIEDAQRSLRAHQWLSGSWDLTLIDDALSERIPFMFSGPQACGKTYMEGALRQVLSQEDAALLWPHELEVNPQVLRIVIPFIGSGSVPWGRDVLMEAAVVRALEENLDFLAGD
jgi:hypothetical protein